MRRTLTLLAAFLWLAAPTVQASEWVWLEENDGLRQARQALVVGNATKAAAMAERALAGSAHGTIGGAPKALLRQGHALLCVCYRLTADWSRAERHCDAAVKLSPSDWRGYVNRAALAIEQERFVQAREDLERARSLAPPRESAVEKNMALLSDLQARN